MEPDKQSNCFFTAVTPNVQVYTVRVSEFLELMGSNDEVRQKIKAFEKENLNKKGASFLLPSLQADEIMSLYLQ